MSLEKQIFKNGSTTYYFSSKFFPKSVRQDVFKLYSFVRIADNYVDRRPQNVKEFKILRDLWTEAAHDRKFSVHYANSDSLNERLVKNMVHLTRKHGFETEWIDAFFESMQADVDKQTYASLDGSLWYVYGSAEVIGLMMARILGLPPEANEFAVLQGRAMQWINFIRDIDEDVRLGRQYFPTEELKGFKLKDLRRQTAERNKDVFEAFIRHQLSRYHEWQCEARKGFRYLPKRSLIPLKTAVDMFDWTATKIEKDPFIVFTEQVKPKKTRVVRRAVRHTISRNASSM